MMEKILINKQMTKRLFFTVRCFCWCKISLLDFQFDVVQQEEVDDALRSFHEHWQRRDSLKINYVSVLSCFVYRFSLGSFKLK